MLHLNVSGTGYILFARYLFLVHQGLDEGASVIDVVIHDSIDIRFTNKLVSLISGLKEDKRNSGASKYCN
jgi:hypothetical protein